MSFANNSLTRSIVSGLAGFVAYGGWAFYANYDHGVEAAMQAALTQGSYSFCVTLVMETLFRLLAKPALRFCVTFFGTCSVLYSTSWGVNVLAGTPEIFITILPGVIIGTAYTFVYTLSLARLQAVKTVE